MSFRRSDRPAERAESERLLDAARAGTPPEPGGDPLSHLLAAAAAPGAPGELAGEEQALAAFRAARAAPAPVPAVAPRPRHRFRLGAAVAGLAATATAGVAFAAVSLDRSPEPAPPPAPTTSGSTGAGGTGPGTPTDSGSGSAGPTGDVPSTAPTPGPPGAPGGPGRPPTAGQLAGLCRGYLAKSDQQRTRALETSAFADLVTAAGGADRVEGYCLDLVPEKSPEPAPKPSADAGGKTPSADDRRATPATPAAPTPRTGKPTTAPGR